MTQSLKENGRIEQTADFKILNTHAGKTDLKAPYDIEDFSAKLNGKNPTNDANTDEEENFMDNGMDVKFKHHILS